MDELNFVFTLLLFAAGFFASVVNMLAGGGSMIVLGLMVIMGVEPAVANATNRIGVLVSTASGAAALKSEKFTDIKESLKLSLLTMPGAILGALFSVRISNELFEKLLAFVMVFVIVSLFLPQKTAVAEQSKIRKILIYPAMILVGFYGGFIQVGVGILIYGTLRHLSGMELMNITMHRVFIVLLYTIPAIVIFIVSGKINWVYALILSAGNALGSWMTIKLALKKGDIVVKIGLAVTAGLMILRFLMT
ncbi:sulfite exporter TauE/SafE family protein [Oceanispirochaeta sp.]|jgi:uncharacterized membrane protein YfcA|uniref:sulfite exporter TauE/SafE family protein n=1 Tax=Oceanispirochaeta sp. TaxID=2035350 RepID=UPI0026275A78|nr:sulfite exporter TauE/SafE family protein [Oceanispirochaeta sp.]MDA3955952.1 sulfite exporter TauE/SafE family protein [Oceanispirochaeta sp.]